MLNRSKFNFYLPLIVGLLIYTTFRAFYLSLTCDEASTYLSHFERSTLECFYDKSCWGNANNHLLNTFLIQYSVKLFGLSELTLRLPNLLAHLCYLVFSLKLIHKVSDGKKILTFTGFCLLNLTPYFIEFFSLARGYALGAGFMMMSIYYFYQAVEGFNWKDLSWMYFGAFMAVMANFVYLNYFVAVSGVLGLVILKDIFLEKELPDFKSVKWMVVPVVTGILLFLLIHKPIGFLKNKAEFEYGTATLYGLFENLLWHATAGNAAIPTFDKTIWTWLLIALVLIFTLNGLKYFFRKRWTHFQISQFAISGIFSLWILAMVFQKLLFGTQYLENRTLMPLIPLIALLTFHTLVSLHFKQSKLSRYLAGIVTFLFVFHFLKTANLKRTQEWYYDESTKNMVHFLKENYPEFKTKELGVYWKFRPATRFYCRDLDATNAIKRLQEEDFEDLNTLDYIYIQHYQKDLVPANFEIIKEFPPDNFLYKREVMQ